MNRNFGYSQFIIPNPCHFPKYSDDPKIKAQGIRQKWDPVSKRLVNINCCSYKNQSSIFENFQEIEAGGANATFNIILDGGDANSNEPSIIYFGDNA
jgi:hypothetical protein